MEKTLPKIRIVKVSNEEEFLKHISITEEAWKENKWTLEALDRPDANRYLIYRNDLKEPFGTFEYTPYLPDLYNTATTTTLEDIFSFKEIDIVKKDNYSGVFELDKLAVSKEHRSLENLGLILTALITVGHELKAKSLLMLIRPSFFRLLERNFKLPISRVGENVYYESPLIPAILDAELVVKNKEEYINYIYDLSTKDNH